MTVFVQTSRAFFILSGLPSEVVYKNAPYITAPTAATPIPAVKILMTCFIILMIATYLFMKTPAFGALPSGKSLEKVKASKNYVDGEFKNKESNYIKLQKKSLDK